ncbi:MAG: hypothetical protein OXF49_02070 [Candidatus Saccharibacteria bacterium]|nr:hypothetical protein [Candidatus Saccharibacteria bacterium]
MFCGLLLALGLISVSAQATPTVTMTLSSSSNEGNSGFTDVTVTLDYADLAVNQTRVEICLGGTAISGGLYGVDLPVLERNTVRAREGSDYLFVHKKDNSQIVSFKPTNDNPQGCAFGGILRTHVGVPSTGRNEYKIRIIGDQLNEADETVIVSLVNPTNELTIASGSESKTLTIKNDDFFPKNTDGSYTVPSNWDLLPSGLESGDKFRLLFTSSQQRALQGGGSDLSTYDTWIQNQVARSDAHVALSQIPRADWKVVGSSQGQDARDHLGMYSNNVYTDGSTNSSSDGISIHWVNGNQVADNYFEFCTGSWDTSGHAATRNEQGTTAPNRNAWSGSNNSCRKTRGPYQIVRNQVRVAGIGGPLTEGGSVKNYDSSQTRPMFGMSGVLVVGSNEPVFVSLEPVDAVMTEGSSTDIAEVKVKLSRLLDRGETVVVHLTESDKWDLAVASPVSGVTFVNQILTFSRPGVSQAGQEVTIQVTSKAGSVDGTKNGAISIPLGLVSVGGTGGGGFITGHTGESNSLRLMINDSANTGHLIQAKGTSQITAEGQPANVRFTLPSGLSTPTEVKFHVVHGTGDVGSLTNANQVTANHGHIGYRPVPNAYSVNIQANSVSSPTVGVPFIDDDISEPLEKVYIMLGDLPVGVRANNFHTLQIAESDISISLQLESTRVVEGDSGHTEIKVIPKLSVPSSSNREFSLSLAGTATYGATADYALYSNGTLVSAGQDATFSIPAGSLKNESLTLRIYGDTVSESDETVILTLGRDGNSPITLGSPSSQTLTIVNDDYNVSFEESSYEVVEGGQAQLTLVLSQPRSQDTVISVLATGSTAIGNVDFQEGSFSVTIPAGQTKGIISIPTIADNMKEGNEQFGVSIARNMLPSGVDLGSPFATNVTIVEQFEIQFTQTTSSFAEDAGNQSIAVSFGGAGAGSAFTLEYELSDHTRVDGAVGNYDYYISGQGHWVGKTKVASGATSANIGLTLKDDDEPEGDETFTITLLDPDGDGPMTLGSKTEHTVTITDNDTAPTSAVRAYFADTGSGRITSIPEGGRFKLPVELTDAQVGEDPSTNPATAVSNFRLNIDFTPAGETASDVLFKSCYPEVDDTPSQWKCDMRPYSKETWYFQTGSTGKATRGKTSKHQDPTKGFFPAFDTYDDNVVEDNMYITATLRKSGAAKGIEAGIANQLGQDKKTELDILVRDEDRASVYLARGHYTAKGSAKGNIWVSFSKPVEPDVHVNVFFKDGTGLSTINQGSYEYFTEHGEYFSGLDTGVTDVSLISHVILKVPTTLRHDWLWGTQPCIEAIYSSLTLADQTPPSDCTGARLGMHQLENLSKSSVVVPTVTLEPVPQVVPSDWPLIPSGLSGEGTRFRLLFYTSERGRASSTDINDYNQFVQGLAADGHDALARYAGGFRVVGSTESVDARVNTWMQSSKGVPVYWLDGVKVADDNRDFYDGSWNANQISQARDENGNAITEYQQDVENRNGTWTGSNNDGTGREGHELGTSRPMLSLVSFTRSNSGPLFFNHFNGTRLPNTTERFFYAISQPFEIGSSPQPTQPVLNKADATDGGYYSVPHNWSLIPSNLQPGDKFRLLFRTTARGDATSTDIATYDTRVQTEITGGSLDAIKPYASGFKAVGSTQTLDVRDHLKMWGSNAYTDGTPNSDAGDGQTGIQIYWLDDTGDGALVARSYADFCHQNPDSSGNPQDWWQNDSLSDYRNQNGEAFSNDNNWPWTGSSSNCTKRTNRWLGHASDVEIGAHREGRTYGPLSQGRQAPASQNSLYGMSPIFLIEPEIGAIEGNTIVWEFSADSQPSHPVVVSTTLHKGGSCVESDTGRHVVIHTNGKGQRIVETDDDSYDEPTCNLHLYVHHPDNSVWPSGGSHMEADAPLWSSQAVVDDDNPSPGVLGSSAPPIRPFVNVLGAVSSGIEGGDVEFIIEANPAPEIATEVDIIISQTGDFLPENELGRRTVTLQPTLNRPSRLTIVIPTINDDVNEIDGDITLTLVSSADSLYEIGYADSLSMSIIDNDRTPPNISVDVKQWVSEAGVVVFTISADPVPLKPLDVNLSLSQLGDYVFQYLSPLGNQVVTIPTSGSIDVLVYTDNDRIDESSGAVVLTINAGEGYTVSSERSVAKAAVMDNDGSAGATPEISIAPFPVITEGGNAIFVIYADPVPTVALPVSVMVSQQGDYVASNQIGSQTITIRAGVRDAYVIVPTVNDATAEADGFVTATLQSGSGYTVSTVNESTVVWVFDDDTVEEEEFWELEVVPLIGTTDDDEPPVVEPEISVTAGAGITEGSSASFTITANPAPSSPLTVNLAVTQTGDYGVAIGSKTVVIPTSGSKTYSVATVGDNNDETNGLVTVTLKTGTGYSLSTTRATASVAVADDDEPPVNTNLPTLTIEDAWDYEGDEKHFGGLLYFRITLSEASSETVTVRATTQDDTADASVDFGSLTAWHQTVKFKPGETRKTVLVLIVGDKRREGNETFNVILSDVVGATLATTQATGTIIDDD